MLNTPRSRIRIGDGVNNADRAQGLKKLFYSSIHEFYFALLNFSLVH